MNVLYKYADCQIIKGHLRAIIYDLTREKYYFIPLEFANLLNFSINKSMDEIYMFKELKKNEIKHALDYLLENEICIFLPNEQTAKLKPIENHFEYPGNIESAIMYFNAYPTFRIEKCISILIEQGLKSIVIIFDDIEIIHLDRIIKIFKHISIPQFELIFNYNIFRSFGINYNLFDGLAISNVVIFNAPKEDIITLKNSTPIGFFTKEKINLLDPPVDMDYFIFNHRTSKGFCLEYNQIHYHFVSTKILVLYFLLALKTSSSLFLLPKL